MVRVSVGLPTYNGADTILECLQSLQAQTFTDFEVLISDNASTDGTSDICADVCRGDHRFRHVRLSETVPAVDNFCRARDLTRAPYFMWRADDDLADPDHLRNLVSALDRAPKAKLAVAPILRLVGRVEPRETLFDLPPSLPTEPIDRIAFLLDVCRPSWFYGLWRREAALWEQTTRDYGFLWASDHLAMLPAILDDAVELAPGARFIQRIVREPSYKLPPEQLLAARSSYARIATAFLDDRSFSAGERRVLDRAMRRHLKMHVAPLWKNIRRVAEGKVRSLLGLHPKRV